MITHYTVVHYLPRPLSGERINVGVIAWSGDRIAARFLGDWRRVRTFGAEDIDFLRDFARRVEESAETALSLPGITAGKLDEAQLRKFIGSWVNSIQFSEPGSSVKSPSEVVEEVAPIFLRKPQRRGRRPRNRRFAAMFAVQTISAAVRQVTQRSPQEFVHRNQLLRGKLDEHQFDVVVSNGGPLFAAQGLSFELPDTATLSRELEATAWAIDDVRKGKPKLPLGVVALPPRGKSILFKRATKIFAGLGADLMTDRDLDKWAKQVAKKTLA